EEQAEKEAEEKASATKAPAKEQEDADSGESMTLEATAYTAEGGGCAGSTPTGSDLEDERDKNVIAVDSDVRPLGSTVQAGRYGEAIAGDTGRDMQGGRIDVHVPTNEDAMDFGRKSLKVTVLD